MVTNGPPQDIMDQMLATTFETFMGMEHVNCVLCHNGRGHLDSINLWAVQTTRYQAWQLSSYMSHTNTVRTPVVAGVNNVYYWKLLNNQRNFTNDYTLNTTIGNRPERQSSVPGCRPGRAATRCRRNISSPAPRPGPARITACRWRTASRRTRSSRAPR